MSEELLVWIMGICVLLMVVAMAAQALAGLRILQLLTPFLEKQRQLVTEGKHLAETTTSVVRETKPGLSTTTNKVRDLAKATAERASEWKQGMAEIADSFARLRGSRRAKPRRIRTLSEPEAGSIEDKIEEKH